MGDAFEEPDARQREAGLGAAGRPCAEAHAQHDVPRREGGHWDREREHTPEACDEAAVDVRELPEREGRDADDHRLAREHGGAHRRDRPRVAVSRPEEHTGAEQRDANSSGVRVASDS